MMIIMRYVYAFNRNGERDFCNTSSLFFLDCQRMTVSSKCTDRIVRIVPVGVDVEKRDVPRFVRSPRFSDDR